MSRPTAAAIGALLEGGGFRDVEVEELEVTMEYGSAEEFTRSVQALVPPITNLLKPHPPAVQQEVWQAVTDAARARASEDGSVRMTNLVLVAAGQAPR
jgi:phage-related tail fiber protein